ncbi:hypothetical protein IAR55_007065 [Kwoniella newhampshirensis]|uniref:Sorting nexin MVP1 n=1 Tax=Kwoniella newhampshirensis TaxID=1651941 RepID=A0AAW0YW90_9TREE
MFNAPRRMGGPALAQSSLLKSTSSSAYADPLASSAPLPGGSGFGDLDPWSAAPSPARSETPRRDSAGEDIVPGVGAGIGSGLGGGREGLNGLIDDPPALYASLLEQLDPNNLGEVSLSSVHRLLATSRLPAITVEKIINLTSREKSSLARQEFFCALALVALAQSSPSSDPDISIEQLSASLAKLPLPDLKANPSPSNNNTLNVPLAPARGYSEGESPSISNGFDAWETAARQNGNDHSDVSASGFGEEIPTSTGYSVNGSAFQEGGPGVEAESQKDYWKKLETVEVSLTQKEGWFLQKYTVESSRRSAGPVSRRYSDFVWLLDTLLKRYPFRLLPALPPKRIGPDAIFLETRRKGLRRFINFVVNHPVMKDDGALNVFLTEPSFESWRKRTKVSTDEESLSKKLNHAQEMSIPADLEEKLGVLRDHLPAILGSYQKLVVLAERGLGRLQAQAGDASRMALSVQSVGEEMRGCCYRCVAGATGGCSLCEGVGRGLGEVGESWTRVAEESEKRAATILSTHIESLKSQRDLYLSFRDLFVRHDRFAKDSVESLRKKVETRQKKAESLKAAQKAGWEVEVDKLVAATDQDNSQITILLARRVFIRACMWHELSIVHHSRQAAQATLGWRQFARDQNAGVKAIGGVWEALEERLDAMPVD